MAEEGPKMFSLRLAGDGINIEQQIDRRVALQIVQIMMGGSPPESAPVAEGAMRRTRSTDDMLLSLREYLDQVAASKKPDQITTIAHYICEYEGQDDFGRADVRSRFLAAREPLPGNFGRDFAVAVRNGWIAEVHGKKDRFYVTAKGLHAIGSNFSRGKGAAMRR